MDAEYIKKIQKWVQLDNKVMELNDKLKPLQEEIKTIQEGHKDIIIEKDELEQDIVDYVQSKKMDMLTINTSDGNIKFSKRNTTQSLSVKILNNLLGDYHRQHPETNTEDIYNYVINALEKKTKLSIKRNLK